MDPTKALPPSVAARRLALSKAMVCLLCRQGKLDALRTPLGWLIDPEDVERLRLERQINTDHRHARPSDAEGHGDQT